MMSDQPTDARTRLRNHFAGTEAIHHGKKWDELYKANFLPWDKGVPNPALVEVLEKRDLIGEPFVEDRIHQKRRKRALVPGCGKGYDVLLLSSFGYDAYGLEISENALDAAKANEQLLSNDETYKERAFGKGGVTWLFGDFFKADFLTDVDGDGTFDLLYDYTFLSALPVSLRPAWSRRCNQLLSPGGRLVCVEFPTYKEPNTGGPPWALPPKVYLAHLPRPGEYLPYDDDIGILEEKLGAPSEDGLVQVSHFKPQKTHAIGLDADGKVTDWVGVWSH